MTMPRGSLLLSITLLSLLSLPFSAAAQSTLRVVSWGGAYQEAQTKAFFEPFEKQSGVKIVQDSWTGKLGNVRAMVQSGNINVDLYDANPQDVIAGCDEGLFEKFDTKFLGTPAEFSSHALTDCGVASVMWSYVFAWNADKAKFAKDAGPKTIADIFDGKKYPGKRGLPKRIYSLAEYVLMSEGVPHDKVYEILATPAGLERVFKKLDTIKKDIVWYTTGAQPAQLLADGEADFVMINTSRWYNAVVKENKNFIPMWDGQIYSYDVWAIPRGAPNKGAALKFIAFSMQPQQLADFTNVISLPGTRTSSLKLVKPEIVPYLPTSHFETAFLQDGVWWADRLEDYQKRFEVWMQQ